jgi:hypothetical protein
MFTHTDLHEILTSIYVHFHKSASRLHAIQGGLRMKCELEMKNQTYNVPWQYNIP